MKAAPASPVTCLPLAGLRIDGTELIIPPFRIDRLAQRFVQLSELRIELAGLEPDLYRVVAVQDFWSEDHNPNLSEALAGVFLARRRASGTWEEPECWPVECRTLAILCYVDSRTAGCATLIPSDYEH